MKNILIINTGGTFNKIYNPISGDLEVPKNNSAIKNIVSNFGKNFKFRVVGTIFKDSLDMKKKDRKKISHIISKAVEKNIIIIHGTDTINKTAKFLENKLFKNKKIILTGSMKPISINSLDGNLNFASALGYLQNCKDNGVYISMSGLVLKHNFIRKDREKGVFVKNSYKNIE